MATRVDLRGGEIVLSDKLGEVGRVSKVDVMLARNEADILAKLTERQGQDGQTYYFNFDVLFGGWECINGPKGLARPQADDWPSAQRGR